MLLIIDADAAVVANDEVFDAVDGVAAATDDDVIVLY